MSDRRSGKLGIIVVAATLAGGPGCMPPSWGAGALLHPPRRPVQTNPDRPHQDAQLHGDGVDLAAWIFRTAAPRRGTVVYLHGVADNRGSVLGTAAHLLPRGFDVVAYDSRAHGSSGGAACTYGFFEKRDLGRVLDQVGEGPFILLGHSLGAAVALQTAADDRRIAAVVALSSFSDLRTVARERAPFFASRGNINDAFVLAEAEAHFRADDVNPARAAAAIRCPVLVVHGADDRETPPDHARRIAAALTAPHRLEIIAGAQHNDILGAPATWPLVDAWMDAVIPGGTTTTEPAPPPPAAAPRGQSP